MTILDSGTVPAVLLALLQGPASALPGLDPAVQAAAVERKLHFLVGAYTVVWLILALYLLSLSLRLRHLSRQVRRLKERLGL